MCYLVTYRTTPKSTELNVLSNKRFEESAEARQFAETELKSGSTEVEVWELYAAPKLVPLVEW